MDTNERKHSKDLHENVSMPDRNFMVRIIQYKQDKPKGIFPLHWHEDLELILVESGYMKIECSGNPVIVHAENAIVVNSNEYHCCSEASGDLSLYCLQVDMTVLSSRFFDSCEEKYIQPVFANKIMFNNLITFDPEFNMLIRQIADEQQKRRTGFELAIKSLLLRMIVILLRGNEIKVLSQREHDIRSANLKRVDKIIKYIDQNYMDEINIESIAESIGVSKFYFCKLFKNMTGKTVTDYVNCVRVNEAVSLLRNTEMNVTDIAMTVGFNDANYFSRIFRKLLCKSPSTVRREGRV